MPLLSYVHGAHGVLHPAGLFCMPADTSAPLQVADKLLQPEQPLPLMASESMVPFRDHVIAKHFVLVQDATCMDEGRCGWRALQHSPPPACLPAFPPAGLPASLQHACVHMLLRGVGRATQGQQTVTA